MSTFNHEREQRRQRQAVLAYQFDLAMALTLPVTVKLTGGAEWAGRVTHCETDDVAPPDQSPLVYIVDGRPIRLRDVTELIQAERVAA